MDKTKMTLHTFFALQGNVVEYVRISGLNGNQPDLADCQNKFQSKYDRTDTAAAVLLLCRDGILKGTGKLLTSKLEVNEEVCDNPPSHVKGNVLRAAVKPITKKMLSKSSQAKIERRRQKKAARKMAKKAARKLEIPGLAYPVVITKDGEIQYDLFGATSEGRDNFNEFCRQHSIHAVTQAAKKRGYRVISAPRVAEDGWTEIDIDYSELENHVEETRIAPAASVGNIGPVVMTGYAAECVRTRRSRVLASFVCSEGELTTKATLAERGLLSSGDMPDVSDEFARKMTDKRGMSVWVAACKCGNAVRYRIMG